MSRVSDSRISDDLWEITKKLVEAGWDKYGGFLGGEFGYGTHYENEVFEMHPFYWGECECERGQLEVEWYRAHGHTEDCYQSELDRRGITECRTLAKEWGLPELGSAVHCTCGYGTEYEEWISLNPHDPKCGSVLPNFHHKASGFKLEWYKYIGRGMEFEPVTRDAWAKMIAECEASITLNPDYVEPEPVEPMTDEEWEKEYRVFSGSFDEVIQQVSETFHPVQSIEQLDCNDF